MRSDSVRLMEPALRLEGEFIAMVNEYLEAGEQKDGGLFEQAVDDFAGYVTGLLDHAEGNNLPEGWVPGSAYWLVEDGCLLIGLSSLRHRLTPGLKQRGGHIGYYIRPSQRRKGYGTVILALTLEKAHRLGLERVLVTCDKDNAASARVIERNGGKLENEVICKDTGKPTLRYWIDLTCKGR